MSPMLDEELRSLRRSRGLSLGAAAALAGVSKSSLAAWESGANRPRGLALSRLLDALEADSRARARLLQAADPAFARIELAHSPFGAPIDVGAILRAMRERRGLTQADLALRVGVTQSAVSRWEAGENAPPPEAVHAVGFALGANVEETLALASAQGGGSGLSDDLETALGQIQVQQAGPFVGFGVLREVVSLGHEAEIWSRAAHDPRWDVCLVSVLSLRADWLVGQERWNEVAATGRRAVAMAKTTEERRRAVPAVAALADYDRHRGAGHRAAAELAGFWAERLPEDQYRAWMLSQKGLCLARMGAGDQGAALAAEAAEINIRITPRVHLQDPWSYRTLAQCDTYLAAGEPAKAAALVAGRRERMFSSWTYVRIEHASGRAVTDADMAYLRYDIQSHQANPLGIGRLERLERRQAKLTGGAPVPYLPGPTDPATGDRLWAAVLRENPG